MQHRLFLLVIMALTVMTAIAFAGSSGARAEVQEIALARQTQSSETENNAVARVVRGIISYTYWPVTPQPLRLCLVGQPLYRNQLIGGLQPIGNRTTTVSDVLPLRDHVQNCDVLYLDVPSTLYATALTRPGVLTISEQDLACRGGAMFCLRVETGRVSFRLNLDAVARSGLRVDPKVLILGRSGGNMP